MNILMLNYEFPPIGGGASPVSYDIGKRLVERGHRITVVTMAYKDLPEHEMVEGMEIYRVRCLRTKKMVCHPWEQATYILSAIHFISHKLEIEAYDLCYTHFIIPTGPVAWWLKKRYQLPYIITSHGSDVIGHNNKRFKWLYALVRKPWCGIVKAAETVVSPSQYLMDLMKLNEPEGNYELIQNGVDTSFFARSEKKKKKILIMCRLQETKNVQQIIRALAKVKIGDWEVDIMGDGPYKQELIELVKEKRMDHYIHFKGWVTNKSEEHLQCLQEASIYITASRVENCPTSILEAISCGDRVLVSDIPAHRQLVGKVDDSVFFKLDKEDELTEKIQRYIDCSEQENAMSNHYDIHDLDWRKSIDKYEELINGTN